MVGRKPPKGLAYSVEYVKTYRNDCLRTVPVTHTLNDHVEVIVFLLDNVERVLAVCSFVIDHGEVVS